MQAGLGQDLWASLLNAQGRTLSFFLFLVGVENKGDSLE